MTTERLKNQPIYQKQLATREVTSASQPAIHLSEDLQARSIEPKQSAQFEGVGVYHVIYPPGEVEMTFTHHALAVLLNTDWRNFRQVSRFAGQEYYGSSAPAGIVLIPAKTSSFFSWNIVDESLTLAIEPSALQQAAIESECLNPNRVELLPIVYGTDHKLGFLAKSFKEELQNSALGGRLYSESLINLFLIHLLRHYCVFAPKPQKAQNGLPKHKLKQAIEYIHANLGEDISLQAMAQAVDVSQYYFCRLFKQSTGLSPYQYVLKCRINRAKELLSQGQTSIADVALQVGFTSQSHFTTYFKRLVGVIPKQILK